jgi:hypothetical protein
MPPGSIVGIEQPLCRVLIESGGRLTTSDLVKGQAIFRCWSRKNRTACRSFMRQIFRRTGYEAALRPLAAVRDRRKPRFGSTPSPQNVRVFSDRLGRQIILNAKWPPKVKADVWVNFEASSRRVRLACLPSKSTTEDRMSELTGSCATSPASKACSPFDDTIRLRWPAEWPVVHRRTLLLVRTAAPLPPPSLFMRLTKRRSRRPSRSPGRRGSLQG